LNSNAFPGTSALAYAFIGGLSISQALLIAPLATFIISKFGTRTCLNIGIFFETISLLGASFSRELWQLILSQGICMLSDINPLNKKLTIGVGFGWGMGFLFTASVCFPTLQVPSLP
jgi:hypothetical protein